MAEIEIEGIGRLSNTAIDQSCRQLNLYGESPTENFWTSEVLSMCSYLFLAYHEQFPVLEDFPDQENTIFRKTSGILPGFLMSRFFQIIGTPGKPC
ncbi:MAG TPA: hypothetical protein HPP81_03695 [Deltaproteobacteria bacterium]|nr:hypothetical protein [Deltaproteobacteria bacterium]